jgi:predicted nucleotidyltransferase
MIKSLFPKTKRTLLALMFLHPDQRYYLRQIGRLTGIGQGALQRELKNLVDIGILRGEKSEHQTFYAVNTDNPIFEELRGIVYKTFGVAEILQKVLKPLQKKIDVAVIYGSIAREEETVHSDIDLMLIGSVTFAESSIAIGKAEKSLGRTINPTVYPTEEFRRRFNENNHFLNSVIKTPLIFLIGNEDDIGKLVGQQVAAKA